MPQIHKLLLNVIQIFIDWFIKVGRDAKV